MEIVSEGSLESISRPASCDSVRASKDLKKHGQTMGFLEELPPEVVAISLDEDIESEDELIISPLENDVIIEDIQEWSTTAQSTDPDDSVDDDDDNASEGDALDTNNGKVKRSSSPQGESIVESNVDPKIKKGLEKIRKLDAILADKIKKEKDVKTLRKQLEKKWREEISQLDKLREQEGHGKIELSVAHALALGPPADDSRPDELESVPVTPVFATQLSFAPSDCSNMHSPSDRCTGRSSSCDSWTEQDIDEVQSKSSKKTPRKKKGNKARAKEKEQNFVKRNIELAADAGSLIPMTEAEKKRLEELLSDETDLLMVENAYVEGLTLPAGEGFTLDSQSLVSLADIDSKLQDLVPQVEMDLLASHESWKSITDSKTSSHDAESVKDVEKLGLGERILGEDKEMREMKRRLVAIEADLQALYRDDNNESEVGLSDEILAKLIGDSSRTTSYSNTISESVISALSSSRSQETTPIQTPASIEDNQTNYARSDIIRSASAVDTREDRTRSQQSSSTLEHD